MPRGMETLYDTNPHTGQRFGVGNTGWTPINPYTPGQGSGRIGINRPDPIVDRTAGNNPNVGARDIFTPREDTNSKAPPPAYNPATYNSKAPYQPPPPQPVGPKGQPQQPHTFITLGDLLGNIPTGPQQSGFSPFPWGSNFAGYNPGMNGFFNPMAIGMGMGMRPRSFVGPFEGFNAFNPYAGFYGF